MLSSSRKDRLKRRAHLDVNHAQIKISSWEWLDASWISMDFPVGYSHGVFVMGGWESNWEIHWNPAGIQSFLAGFFMRKIPLDFPAEYFYLGVYANKALLPWARARARVCVHTFTPMYAQARKSAVAAVPSNFVGDCKPRDIYNIRLAIHFAQGRRKQLGIRYTCMYISIRCAAS